MQTNLKFLPRLPSQRRLNWLAEYIDDKKDNLYGLVFSYQLIDAYIRGLIYWKTKKSSLADVLNFNHLVGNFVDNYPMSKRLANGLGSFAKHRHLVMHQLLTNSKITNARKLELLIKQADREGLKLFTKLKKFKNKFSF